MQSESGAKIATNAPDASRTHCACGCGRELTKKRPWQKYYSDECRRRAHRKDSLNLEKLALLRRQLHEALKVVIELEESF